MLWHTKKISSGRKEQAFYLLLEEGWKIERVALASGVSVQSIERWEVNYGPRLRKTFQTHQIRVGREPLMSRVSQSS